MLLTGKIYYKTTDAQGNLKTWSTANKVVAFIFVFVQLILIVPHLL
ncbi:MAG TPA: hypothetical protein VG753_00895 [Candidatus Paceibacterota bacterium]|nr:hypothetical protein [Candidatus Paceibacterota bacterium]